MPLLGRPQARDQVCDVGRELMTLDLMEMGLVVKAVSGLDRQFLSRKFLL